MPKRVIKHLSKTKKTLKKHLKKPHQQLCDRFSWYKWWHEQDVHRHIHYAAMVAGIVVAVYYIMLEEIYSNVNL